MSDYCQSDIDELKKACINEYPFPFYVANSLVGEEVFRQLKEEYKNASFQCSDEMGNAICLDNLSRTYYAAMLMGADRRMVYFNFSCLICPHRDAMRFERNRNDFIKEYNLEAEFKAMRDDLSDCRKLV